MRLWIFLLITGTAFAQPATIASRTTDLLRLLPAAANQKIHYEFGDSERFNWHFVPRSRHGIALRDLNPGQRDAVFSLLKASLSEHGYHKTSSIVELENVLRAVEGRGG